MDDSEFLEMLDNALADQEWDVLDENLWQEDDADTSSNS
jgi:hypothetical protein